MKDNKLIEYLIRPFGSNNKDLYKQYPLNIENNPSDDEYSINDILEDISILYSIYCGKKDDKDKSDSLGWFLSNRKLADTGNDTTDLNRRIARELLYLSLLNLVWYIRICFNKIKDELEKSANAKLLSKELNNNISLALDNITNIMFYNAADLFGFWKLESFIKTKDEMWPGTIVGDTNIISSEDKKILRLAEDAFDLPLDDTEKFKKRFLFALDGDTNFKAIVSEKKIEFANRSGEPFSPTGIFVTKSKPKNGSYQNYFILISNNKPLVLDKPLYYIKTGDYKDSTLHFTKFLVGTSNLVKGKGKEKHSMGLFDSTNSKKNRLIMDVFVQYAKNNRLQVNKLIKYIDYFLRNYLTKMPLEYVKELKTKFDDGLDIIKKESDAKKRSRTEALVKEYSKQYEGLIERFAEVLIDYLKDRHKIKMNNASINDLEDFENNEYKLIVYRNEILFFKKMLRIIYQKKVESNSGTNKSRIKQAKKYNMPDRILNDLTVNFKKARTKIEKELRKKTNVRDMSLEIGEKYDLILVFRKLLNDETDVGKYIYKRNLDINMLRPRTNASDIREQANAVLARNTESGCVITGDHLLSIKKIKGAHTRLRNKYTDQPRKYLAEANKKWDSELFAGLDPFNPENRTIYLPLVDYGFSGFSRILLDLKKWLRVFGGNSAEFKNFSDCTINVNKMANIKGLVLVNGLNKNIKNFGKWKVMSSQTLRKVHEKTKLNMDQRYKFVINLLTSPEMYKKYFRFQWPTDSVLLAFLVKNCFKVTSRGKVGQIKCEKLVSFNCLATRLFEIFDLF